MYYSHIFNLNMNEWVPVKGFIEVVPSNSVSTSNWYWSSTKIYVRNDLRYKFLKLTASQWDPRVLGRHSLVSEHRCNGYLRLDGYGSRSLDSLSSDVTVCISEHRYVIT